MFGDGFEQATILLRTAPDGLTPFRGGAVSDRRGGSALNAAFRGSSIVMPRATSRPPSVSKRVDSLERGYRSTT
jgi:hypothetical protein